MYSFLVLGQIPGTSFQISFNNWLVFVALSLLFVLAYRHGALNDKPSDQPVRVPLHASQLHLRA